MEPGLSLAELVGSLALATDLALGHPLEQGLGACVVATRLAELADLPPDELRRTFYVALLRHIGCTTENDSLAGLVGGDEVELSAQLNALSGGTGPQYLGAFLRYATQGRPVLEKVRATGRVVAGLRAFGAANQAICEVARTLAGRLGFDPDTVHAVGTVYERFDGKGMPNRLRGGQIRMPVRLAQVADLAAALHDLGRADVEEVVRGRAGGGFDPAVVDLFCGHAAELVGLLHAPSRWEAVQRLAPRPEQPLAGDRLTQALHAVADFTDLKSPYLVGHSSGVSDLARGAAERLGLPAPDVDEVGLAALVHDVGRIGVSAAVWGKPGPLTAGEWEAVRLHPYQTGRVLGRAPFLARLAAIPSLHHQRLDGSRD